MGKGNNGKQIRKHANVAGNGDIREQSAGIGRRSAKHVGKRATSKSFVGAPTRKNKNQKGKGKGIRGEQKGGREQTNQKRAPLLQPTKSHGAALVE